MVSVYFGKDSSAILDVDTCFRNRREDRWLSDEVVKEMVRDIDNSIVDSPYCITSPVLGQIPPDTLSGGVKACILLYKLDDIRIDLVACGENCEKWLSWVFNNKDVKVSMSGYDLLFEGYDFNGVCENDGSIISSADDWSDKMIAMAGEIENER